MEVTITLKPAYNSTKQVTDDPELITLMMEELDKANELYRPTNIGSFTKICFFQRLREKGFTISEEEGIAFWNLLVPRIRYFEEDSCQSIILKGLGG